MMTSKNLPALSKAVAQARTLFRSARSRRDEFEAAAVRGRGVAHRRGCGLRLDEIAGCTDDVGTVRRECAGRLDAKTGGDASDEHALAA